MRVTAKGTRTPGHHGTTLIELVVVLGILGVLLGISALALTSLRPVADQEARQRIDRARHQALATGVAVMLADDSGRVIRLLPDGRALGNDLDPLSGKLLRDER